MLIAQERIDARVHRDAALSQERSAGYWVKPYEEFTPHTDPAQGSPCASSLPCMGHGQGSTMGLWNSYPPGVP